MTHAEGQLKIPYGVLVVAKDPVRVPTGRRLPGLDGSTALAVRRRLPAYLKIRRIPIDK
ncbi:MAG: hypothetical protein VCB25_00480 [Myxococcota bacterium]